MDRSDRAFIRCQYGCAIPPSQVKLLRRHGRINTGCLMAAPQTMAEISSASAQAFRIPLHSIDDNGVHGSGESSPRSRRRSVDISSDHPIEKPIPRKKRTHSGKGDAISVVAQLNDKPVSAVVLNPREFGERQSDSGGRDIAITPHRRDIGSVGARRPQSCHVFGRQSSQRSPDQEDFGLDTNAANLRLIAYKNWCRKHAHSAQLHRMDSLKQETLDTKKQRELLEKSKSNEQAFEAWRAQKRTYFREQLRQKRLQEEERQKKLEEANQRKLSSSKVSSSTDKAFDVWKSRKDAVLRKQYRDSLYKEKTLLEAKAQVEAEKRAQSEQAFEVWKARKEALAREELHNQRVKQSEEEKQRDELAREKSEKAAEAYYQWELRKVSSMDNLRKSASRESIVERFPWRPPSARASPAR
ncbi:unnamed protein product [Echinostoma caproni]|uniref:Microtubule-associated protein 9 n=1 Tax=Echinostoma caproni TaxID=27848 RepID=A0A3P8G8F4_9TREM|nr:unnamed protein product [Echinostoma caproni]